MEGKKADQYEEFEPLCKWQRNEDREILEIHLQEFKKEQLKVQISNYGVLKISGERPLEASKRTKFYKEIPLPSYKYDTNAINAKFLNGCLYITIPKLKNFAPEKPESSKIDQTLKPESASNQSAGDVPPCSEERGNAALTECEMRFRERRPSGLRLAKVAVSLAATAAAVAVLVAYVVYMYKSTVDEFDDSIC
ncbi:hypothetical protein ABFX02_12G162600 [Erythranthe guttata]